MTGGGTEAVTPGRSALEEALAEPGRDDAIRAARTEIERSGVEHVYYQFASITGRVLGKLAPAREVERSAAEGIRFHGGAVADYALRRDGRFVGYGPEVEELIALPDPSTFRVLPWDASFARVFCDLYRRPENEKAPGSPLPADPRGHLKRWRRAFEDEFGLELRSGCEPEMSWLSADGADPRRSSLGPAMFGTSYHLEELETRRELLKRVLDYGNALGLDMIEGDFEDPGQIELNFRFDSCLRTADNLVTYRQIAKQVARELGVTATFMPKPFAGVMGNGCHHNLSLWSGEENVLISAEERGFALSDVARWSIGGILAHTRGMMAVIAPTANSYARFWEEGAFAPTTANWGFDNRTCTLRVGGRGRLEFKAPDASVNPYLSHAVLLAALADGFRGELDPGPPEEGNTYERGPADDARFPALPRTLGEAVDALAEDGVVRSGLGDELYRVYDELKREEWARACAAVTDWHREMYLNAIP